MKNQFIRYFLIITGLCICFLMNIYIGSVDIPFSLTTDCLLGRIKDIPEAYIILDSRLPMAITAALAGASLSISGLMLQSAFRNPLAGPSVFGISSGASLGVAVVLLMFGGTTAIGDFEGSGMEAVIAGAFVGSLTVTAVMLLLSSIIKNTILILIVGIMVGYLTSSLIMLLNFFSSAEGIQSYVLWGMGNFNSVPMKSVPLMAGITIIGIGIGLLTMKPLNILLLGENYAQNLGVGLKKTRFLLLLSTGILTAVTTAYCGPVGFIGLAVPHLTKFIFPTDNHRILMPGVILTGMATALVCNLLCVVPKTSVLPLNAVTPLVGVPVVFWVIFKGRKSK